MKSEADHKLQIVEADTPERVEAVGRLFREYAASLDFDLSFQNFDAEMASFPAAYRPPGGSLLLALVDDGPAGCVGVRFFEEGVCEMKRLFVQPGFQGRRAGMALARAAVLAGRRLGYRAMRLDTVPSMKRADALYRSLGFRPIPPYRHNPIEGAVYMEMDLTAVGDARFA